MTTSLVRPAVEIHPQLTDPLLPELLHPSRLLWTPRELADLTATVAAELTAGLRDILRFDEDGRWWARLALTDGVELWLLSWLPGQHTKPHDHGGASGSFTVLQGELGEEYRYPGGPIRRRTHVAGEGHRLRRRARAPGDRHRRRARGERPRVLAAAGADARVRVARRRPGRNPAAARYRPRMSAIDSFLEQARSGLDRVDAGPGPRTAEGGRAAGRHPAVREPAGRGRDPGRGGRRADPPGVAAGAGQRVAAAFGDAGLDGRSCCATRATRRAWPRRTCSGWACRNATDLEGGFRAWAAAGLPVQTGGSPGGALGVMSGEVGQPGDRRLAAG